MKNRKLDLNEVCWRRCIFIVFSNKDCKALHSSFVQKFQYHRSSRSPYFYSLLLSSGSLKTIDLLDPRASIPIFFRPEVPKRSIFWIPALPFPSSFVFICVTHRPNLLALSLSCSRRRLPVPRSIKKYTDPRKWFACSVKPDGPGKRGPATLAVYIYELNCLHMARFPCANFSIYFSRPRLFSFRHFFLFPLPAIVLRRNLCFPSSSTSIEILQQLTTIYPHLRKWSNSKNLLEPRTNMKNNKPWFIRPK